MSVQLTIDGISLAVEAGTTILKAAREHGIYVPTLCDYPLLGSRGSCRMCVVEVQGRPALPTACTTPVEEGMVVQTGSARVQELRGELLQMLLAEHPSGCLFCPEKTKCQDCMVTLRKASVTTGCRSCPKDKQCELQDMVERSGLARVGYLGRYRMLPPEKYDPFYDRDYNLCILCGRCVRICEDLHFTNTLAFIQRGSEMVVGTPSHLSHLETGCSFCGACVEACPTGSLMEKTRKWDGKPEGETPSTCPFCSLGCQVQLLSKDGIVIGSLPDHAAGCSQLCVKGRFGVTELVNHPGRLKLPLRFTEGEELKSTWEEAVQAAAEKLAGCSPDGFQMLISSSCSNEDLYVAQKFTRQVMHSANIATSARQRYGAGWELVLDLIARSQPLSALECASTILSLGFDGRYAQSVVEMALHQSQRRGARLLSLNGAEHTFARFADLWLRPEAHRELEVLQTLAQIVSGVMPPAGSGAEGKLAWQLELAGQELLSAKSLLILVGPEFLTHPHSKELLAAVLRLADSTRAQILVFPEQGNLAGAARLGAAGSISRAVEVLFLVGEDLPDRLSGAPTVLYHNLFPPTHGRPAVIFPATAFSETDGTLTDHTGRVRTMRRAVAAHGEARPAWEMLSLVARQMGASGFDYRNVEDIQNEMAAVLGSFQAGEPLNGRMTEDAAPPEVWAPDQISEHTYLGFSLSASVAGLKTLYPQEMARKLNV